MRAYDMEIKYIEGLENKARYPIQKRGCSRSEAYIMVSDQNFSIRFTRRGATIDSRHAKGKTCLNPKNEQLNQLIA